MLKLEHISYSIGKKRILQDVSLTFQTNEINMILGPNGSGKSTLLKIFAGETTGYEGNVVYNNTPIQNISALELAKQRAVMSQQTSLDFPLSVYEVIMMGRYPHFKIKPSKRDEEIVNEVVELLQLQTFEQRNYHTLSGGEKQRVQFARALTQIWQTETKIKYIFLDEPLNNLDINFQQQLLSSLQYLRNENIVIVAIVHDINLALQYATQLFFLKDGALVQSGLVSDIDIAATVSHVFDVNANIIHLPKSNLPIVYL